MNQPPLRVTIVFHPESQNCRDLARFIHHSLNEEALLPGLRIPTIFCPETGDLEPWVQDLDEADRNFVIVLADAHLNASEPWCEFVAELYQECATSAHRLFPIQLDENAWPLHADLNEVSFGRAYLKSTEEERQQFIIRALLIELCRFLEGNPLGGDNRHTSTTLFLSHAKTDLNNEPQVFNAIQEHLSADQPIETWIDSSDIETGSKFAAAIEEGVKNTSIVCILTDSYASREWCRKEILLAKKYDRPAVIIDALVDYEVRSFPYLGNLPRIRWNDNPERAVNLILKETLVYLHDQKILEGYRREDDHILLRAPEAATLVKLPESSSILYPDPPIGIEEKNLLSSLKHSFQTPLERCAENAEFGGRMIAISMSEASKIQCEGFDPIHQDQQTLEICRHLLIAGATLVYGGHLGSQGYTEQLCEMVRSYNSNPDVSPVDLIHNYIGWPLPRPDAAKKSYFKTRAKLFEVSRPSGVDETLHPDFVEEPNFFHADVSEKHRFAWARGMTKMRQLQSNSTDARIVLGGKYDPTETAQADGGKKVSWYMSRIPGVLEEVLLSLKVGKPVFLVGAFGGVARMIIDILQDDIPEEATWEFQKRAPNAEAMKELYQERGEEWWDYPEMIEFIQSKGIAGINPFLQSSEHKLLFEARDPSQIVELILRGLARMPKNS